MALRRDIFGEKPLHSTLCATTNGSIEAFASTASALHRLRGSFGEIRSVREQECTDWLIYGFSDAIAGVDEVWPGGRDDLSDGVAPEHEFGVRRALEGGRQNRLTADQAETLLRQAVSNRLEADVPIGCFLSGGVDSSLIATFASQARPSLETLCVRMPDPRFDESEFAIRVAKVIGSRHQTVDCQANLATDIASLMVQGGVPFGDSSLLPTLWACRAAGRQFRVMLSGDGGDELFGGYERYRAAEVVRRWRWLLSTVPVARLRRSNSRSQSERLARLSDAARAGDAADLLRIFPKALWTGLFSAHSLREIPQLLGHLSAESLIRRDLLLYLPFDLMRKSDSASMSVPLEARAPFLAKGLSSAAMNAPLSSLMPRGQRKGLLRQVARKYLPAEIVDRPKMGFAIPIGEWFRTDYGGLRTMLLDHLNSTEPFGPPSLGIDLNMTFIRQMLDEHLGTGPSGLVKRDHSQRLYMLLVLSIWAKWMGSLKA
jgi:asparagine synthase (glutamine-hydrolysing)